MVSIYQQIKAAGARRYGMKSSNYIRYIDLGQTFFLGAENNPVDIKMNFDNLQKADAKVIGSLINDFQLVECIQLWSDVIDMKKLHRRDKLHLPTAKE